MGRRRLPTVRLWRKAVIEPEIVDAELIEEREALPAEVKAWYRETVEIESPLAAYYPPGMIEGDRKTRFAALQCEHCKGVHSAACPRVRELTKYENGAIKKVVYYRDDEWDPSAVIWAEDVFGDDEAMP